MDIPDELAHREGVPEDLDSSRGGPYRIPSPRRRRLAAAVYLAGAGVAAALWWGGLPGGLLGLAGGLVLLAVYHWASAWDLALDELEALEIANREAGLTVGHASAALGYRGWRSRPVWNVIIYSGEEPPTHRALVRLDAVEGTVLDTYLEDIPPPRAP